MIRFPHLLFLRHLFRAGIFAAGFLMGPIGGWLFERIADKQGRKRLMVISVTMVCAGSLVIACLPTYASIGARAPALLLLAQLFQGLSVGGAYGTTATYMSEIALKGQRGFFSSFQYVALIRGQLLAVLVVILQFTLTDTALRAWGWRIPFVIGALAAVIADTAPLAGRNVHCADRANQDAVTLSNLFKHHKAAFFAVLGYTAGGPLIFHTFTTCMQKYLVNSAGMTVKTASLTMTCALFVYMLVQPLFGILSDRIGRCASMLWFGGLGTLPILLVLRTVTRPVMAFVLIVSALAIVSFYTSLRSLVKAEMFPQKCGRWVSACRMPPPTRCLVVRPNTWRWG